MRASVLAHSRIAAIDLRHTSPLTTYAATRS